ncbi:MAG: DUF1579 domain-containing protein [Phycisphaerales bacterium]
MSSRNLVSSAVVALALASGFAIGLAPDKAPAPAKAPAKTDPKPAPKPEAGTAESDKPGAHHKWLEQLEGDWATEAKVPGSDKSDKGTLTAKMVLGGRFLSLDFDGRSHGQFSRGTGLMGYSNADKRYEEYWAESSSTRMQYFTGTTDAAGKVLTLTGDDVDAAGKKTKLREVTTIISKDSVRSDLYATGADGKEAKILETTYTKGGAPKKEDKK